MTPRAGLGLLVAGAALVVIGVVGLLASGDDDGDGEAAPTTTTTDAATTTTEATTTTTTTEAPVPAETPEELFAVLEAAFQTGDGDTLFARLDPAVLDVYGEVQCRSYADGLERPDLEFEVVEVHAPAPWDFGERDDLAVPIEDAIQVDVVQVVGGERSSVTEAHLRYAGDELRWFTDCGDPV